ncbi:hypothetical protein [Archangium sp.]|uniref:hypothetical protein n=1 Tax=Archangium sp. TaxID=1872627 RepID=UPI002D3357A6|nr:hypothetical protein [Archangium sp.]HYO56777.1 hypothetical protein [Archangium sp.]
MQSHGHHVVVDRCGEYFNIFHVGAFDAAGNLTSRSTHKQLIAFKPDGSMHSLNQINVRWNKLTGYNYSLELVLRLLGSSNERPPSTPLTLGVWLAARARPRAHFREKLRR